MEFVTILLSALLGLGAPVGVVADTLAENALRDRLQSAESLQVRIDNTPSYQLVQGRVDRVRIAGRGLVPIEGVRIQALEVDTDAIALNPQRIRSGQVELQQPLQAGVRLVLTEADLQRSLQSPMVQARLQQLSLAIPGAATGQRYDVQNPTINLLDNGRLQLQVTLQPSAQEGRSLQPITIVIETGLGLQSSTQLQLTDPSLQVNGQTLPRELVPLITQSFLPLLDIGSLGDGEITARLLQLKIDEEQLEIAAFIQVKPEAISGI
ncbi:LmeA family phospholipid-binding protein [Leptolyngbya sp. AN02str]|uniref:LmeA family phospholipid-binding protein n=1 Tax=Leptolyngbya sp. AN02str TaxID=3423363 RepID=UPI003D322BD4